MLAQVMKNVTAISEREDINQSNYLEALSYIEVIYNLVEIIKDTINLNKLNFLPTFKGKNTCEKFQILSTAEENEMKIFKIEPTFILEDTIKQELVEKFLNTSADILINENIIEIIIR